jgi:hypothetical protein
MSVKCHLLENDIQIELQHHGSKLYFKNVYLRELPY